VTDDLQAADFSDPTTQTFWDAARLGKLVVQRCSACNEYQFDPRPFCLACDSTDVGWMETAGHGTVYAVTRIHLDADPDLGLPNPYYLAIVELDEGPRMLTTLTERCVIGTAVRVSWRGRGSQPPVPVFGPVCPGQDTAS
jgi:uncharacterized OB-fold protein